MPRDAAAVPGLERWNIYGEPQAGAAEEAYFFRLLADSAGLTQTLLRNAAGDRGVSLRFAVEQLPCFTLWKNSPAREDGFVTGLEPGVNFPNPRSFEERQGRVRSLAPGETVRFELAIEAHASATSVSRAEQQIAELQSQTGAANSCEPADRLDAGVKSRARSKCFYRRARRKTAYFGAALSKRPRESLPDLPPCHSLNLARHWLCKALPVFFVARRSRN